MQFSIVIITYNCVEQLERTLNSIKKLSDDVLIVDSYSTDSTLDISKKYNTRFIQHKFEGYGQQKNFAIDNAKYDWILIIDSDEVISPNLFKLFKTIKLEWNTVYQCRRRNVFTHKNYSEYYENINWQTILFNRRNTRFKELTVHETIDLSNCNIVRLDAYLNHYTIHSRFEHLRKIFKYARLSTGDNKKNVCEHSFFTIKLKAYFAFFRTYILRRSIFYSKAGLFVAKCSYLNRLLKYS